MTGAPSIDSPTCSRWAHARACAALCAVYAILTWPVIHSGAIGTTVAFDQNYYHLPVIKVMAAEFPMVDLINYRAATTPGYHLVMAVFFRFITDDLLALRFISNLFSMALVIAAYRSVARLCSPLVSCALTLPLVCSMFVIMCGIWLATDNAAWTFVALAVGGVALQPLTIGRLARWSGYATIAVVIRQINLWTLAPLAVAGFLASPLGEFAPSRLTRANGRSTVNQFAWRHSLVVLPALLLPALVVGICVRAWYGLTPLGFQEPHEGNFSVAAPAVALALVGLFGLFYLPVFVSSPSALRSLLARHWRWLMVAAILASTFPTTYNMSAGRWGGAIWSIARLSPSVAHCSIAIILLAGIGGLVLAAACRAAATVDRHRDAAIIMIALAAFTAAQTFNSLCFQRYFEPMILLSLSWLATLVLAHESSARITTFRRWWLGIACLIAMQLALSYFGVYARLTMPGASSLG